MTMTFGTRPRFGVLTIVSNGWRLSSKTYWVVFGINPCLSNTASQCRFHDELEIKLKKVKSGYLLWNCYQNVTREIENLQMNRDGGAAMYFSVATCVIYLCVHCWGISKCGLFWKIPEGTWKSATDALKSRDRLFCKIVCIFVQWSLWLHASLDGSWKS